MKNLHNSFFSTKTSAPCTQLEALSGGSLATGAQLMLSKGHRGGPYLLSRNPLKGGKAEVTVAALN